jgi:hypothetical protein
MMSRRRATGLAAGLAATVALTAVAGPADARRPQDRSRQVPAAHATGPEQSCIRLAEVTNSEVRNDWTIDFERGSHKRIYRSVMPHRCPGLNIVRAFSYQTSLDRLCSTDIVHPLASGGLERGPGCGLGPFTPMELVR